MTFDSRITNIIYPHTNGILRMDFPEEVIRQTNFILENGVNDQAIDRKYEEGITIDGIESPDLDDGIYAEEIESTGGYAVFVSISDITEAFGILSPIDIEAIKRVSSIYLSDGRISDMIHSDLSRGLFSLNENGIKLTMTLKVELDENGEIVNYELYESKFRNRKRYHYQSFQDDFMNPESTNHELLHLMYKIAKKRALIRGNNGAILSYDDSDRKIFIGQKTEKYHLSGKSIASKIVFEFSQLVNYITSMIAVRDKIDTLFRVQTEIEERAYYSNVNGGHKSLALGSYGHFSSPLRRYADNILHRGLKAHLRKEHPPYSLDEVNQLGEYINVSRNILGEVSAELENDIKHGNGLVRKLKVRNGGEINTSHLTGNIRDFVGSKKDIPKPVVDEIIKDLKNGEKSNWAWAIGIFLISGNKDINKVLKRVILEGKKFEAKSIISILNNTKVLRTDEHSLFEITQEDKEGIITFYVKFRGEIIFIEYENIGEKDYKEALGDIRKRVIKKLFKYFSQD